MGAVSPSAERGGGDGGGAPREGGGEQGTGHDEVPTHWVTLGRNRFHLHTCGGRDES